MSDLHETHSKTVLCGANSYEQKYYFNREFAALPEHIREELQIMCVTFTEDVGGIFTIQYDEQGQLVFEVTSDEYDYNFDEIGSALKIKEFQQKKQELMESLELFYKVFILKEAL